MSEQNNGFYSVLLQAGVKGIPSNQEDIFSGEISIGGHRYALIPHPESLERGVAIVIADGGVKRNGNLDYISPQELLETIESLKGINRGEDISAKFLVGQGKILL